jgi:hypothetical protein
MIQLEVLAAAIAVGGGVAAVTARDGRAVAVGLFTAMVASSLVTATEPATLGITFRCLGAVLAAYVLWAATRSDSVDSEGSAIGVAAEIGTAVAAFVVGWFVTLVTPFNGPAAAQAAGFALIALAIVPLTGRNALRAGVAAAVLVLGISLLIHAWIGEVTSLEQIAVTVLVVGIAGATSLLIAPSAGPERETLEADEAAETTNSARMSNASLSATPEPAVVSETVAEAAGRARRLGVREPRR